MGFVPKVSPAFREPLHLAPLVDAIERSARDDAALRELAKTCFSVPVRHGKTSLIQHAIAWLIAKDPTRSILYASYAHGFAAKQVMKAKDLAIKAGVQLGRVQRADEWHTAAGGQVKAAGVGGQITGEGFTHIFVDDPHKNRAEAESRIIRERVIEGFFSDIYTRLDPRGTSFFVVHARWNVNDLIGVLTRMKPHPFDRVNLPALSEDGEPLAPWLYSKEKLEEIRDTVGPYTWASLFQGEPRPRGGALFIDPTFVSQLETPAEYKIGIGLDLATSTRTRADHNAAVVMRRDMAEDVYDVLEVVRARGTIMDRMRDREIVDEGFLRLVQRLLWTYPDATLWMYAARNEGPLVELIERMLTDLMGREITINSLEIKGSKYTRAQAYAASWNAGRVRILGRTSLDEPDPDGESGKRNREGWQSAFVAEHVEFTGVRGEEDDQVDAAVAVHDGLAGDGSMSLTEAMASVDVPW